MPKAWTLGSPAADVYGVWMTCKANLALQPDGTLRLRGYVGAPIPGKTQVWTRVKQCFSVA